MKLYLEKIHIYLIGLNKPLLIALFIIISIFNSLLFSLVSYFITGNGLINQDMDKMGPKDQFFIVVLVAPLIETLIFQYALIESIREKIRPLYACFLSALAFALFHLYSVYYFLFALIGGLTFAYMYYLEKSVIKSLLVVLTAHILYNLLIYTGRRL